MVYGFIYLYYSFYDMAWPKKYHLEVADEEATRERLAYTV